MPSAAPSPTSVLADVNQGPPRFFAPTPSAGAAPTPRAIDPALVTQKGFDTPNPASPGNWQMAPLPQKQADNLRTIAGRGDDAVSRGLQVMNPLTVIPTLAQGGTSALPPEIMGAQPTYPNASDRLKGDASAIKNARDAGFIRPLKKPDPTEPGRSITQLATPVMRSTGQRLPLTAAMPTSAPKFVR